MDWRKRASAFLPAWIALVVLCSPGLAQHAATDSVWTDAQWREAGKGLGYEGQAKKEEMAPEEETDDHPEGGFLDWLGEFFMSTGGKVIALVLVLAILLFTLYRLLTRREHIRDGKIDPDLAYFLEHMEEHFEETDMDRMIRLALESGNLKAAVRVLYLRLLQELHQAGHITWQKDKTNFDFLREMRSRKGYAAFRDLTVSYEVVWYGDTEIRRAQFEQLDALFQRYRQTYLTPDEPRH